MLFWPPYRVSTQWLSSSMWLARGWRVSRCVYFYAMHSQCLPKTVPTTNTLTTRGLCPGNSVVWAGPKFVRPHRWGSKMMVRFLEIQGLNFREIPHHPLPKKSNTCLLPKKRRKNAKEKAHLHQRNQVFPIFIMETILNWVLLASFWRVLTRLGV